MASAEFRERLAEAIRASGKTQRAIAAECGIPQQTLSQYLRGTEPRRKNLAVLFDALPLLRTLEIEALK